MWECGLKPVCYQRPQALFESLLMWECGLKLNENYINELDEIVTPYVGVWIETTDKRHQDQLSHVTPYVGVWIETGEDTTTEESTPSLLMWECGLKQGGGEGVDIVKKSLLMWECGLKPQCPEPLRGMIRHSLCGSVD